MSRTSTLVPGKSLRRRHLWRVIGLTVGLVALAGPITGCVSAAKPAEFGPQPGYEAYIPARIAILPCRAWPTGGHYAGQPPTNAQPADLSAFCQATDAYVLKGFDHQPHMKGFTPKFVQKALTDAGHPQHLAGVDPAWTHQPTDCQTCPNAAAYYSASIAARESWRLWLGQLSRDVRLADAVLLPVVTHLRERVYEDRGLFVAERGGGLALLLIDTGTGALLWAGGRQATVGNQRLAAGAPPPDLAPPPWTALNDRLHTDDLWRGFPGRLAP